MKDFLVGLGMWVGIAFYFLCVLASIVLPAAVLIAVCMFIFSHC